MRFTDPMDHGPIPLPDGLTARPLALTDAHAVFEVMAAQELHDTGQIGIEEEDILGDWQRPSFAIAPNTLGVSWARPWSPTASSAGATEGTPPSTPITAARGWARASRVDAGPSQDHGRGPGRDARPGGQPRRPSPRGPRLRRPLDELGARPPRRSPDRGPTPSWRLRHPVRHRGRPPGGLDRHRGRLPRVVRPGPTAVRGLRRPGRASPGFQPWNLRVVTDPAEQIVGAAFVFLAGEVGYVEKVAVKHAERGQASPGLCWPTPSLGPEPMGPLRRCCRGLTNGRPRPLREGRHGGRRRLAAPLGSRSEPGRPALTSARQVPTVNQEEPRRRRGARRGRCRGALRRVAD